MRFGCYGAAAAAAAGGGGDELAAAVVAVGVDDLSLGRAGIAAAVVLN